MWLAESDGILKDLTEQGRTVIEQNAMFRARRCRFCGMALTRTFVDLGMFPLCQTYIEPHRLDQMEPFYPLHAYVCDHCFLVQLPEYVSPKEIFTEYAYFSSYSDSWLQYVEDSVDEMVEQLHLSSMSQVVEVASNDGYLLQYFVKKGIPVLGVEPAANVALVATRKGIPTVAKFFGSETARELRREEKLADLLLAINVLDHVPDIGDFVCGMKTLLKPTGVVWVEFPSLCRLIEGNQFDTIYHDRFSYLSFSVVEHIFKTHGLTVFDVEELQTHGGSLRIQAGHNEDDTKNVTRRVNEMREREEALGVRSLGYYRTFGEKVKETKRTLLESLIRMKRAGKSIVGYGVPAKGNVLLNYCGIRTDFLDFLVDRSPYKQGKHTPGTHIPIFPVEKIQEAKPDYLLILPWNIKDEVMQQMSYIRNWGAQFVVPIPDVRIQ